MDNRLKFLYCLITELWGHMFRSRAGKGKPGASRGYRWEAQGVCSSYTPPAVIGYLRGLWDGYFGRVYLLPWPATTETYTRANTLSLHDALPILGFSPHPPVSVYGTGTSNTIAAFLDTSSTCFATLVRSTSRPRVDRRFCLSVLCCACTGLSFSGSCFPHVSPHF